MVFSIWDIQCKDYLHSGRNSKTREEAIDEAIEFLLSDWDDEEVSASKVRKMDYEEKADLIYGFELEVEEHNELLPE